MNEYFLTFFAMSCPFRGSVGLKSMLWVCGTLLPFDLIFCVKIFKFEKKEKPPVLRILSLFTRKQARKEEEDKEEEETLLERALLLLRKSSIATTCLSRERGSLFCVFEEFWQKESKEKISFSPV